VLSNNLIFEYIYSYPIFEEIIYLKLVLSSDYPIIWSIFQVENLVLIDASVYAEGTGNLATLPRAVAYAGVSISPT